MKKDNKDLAIVIADSMSPKKEEEGKETESSDSDDDMSEEEVAASEVMDAMKSGNVADFTESLKSFIKICSYGE